jgi:radical SAM protein with 4Fe4S-binding SPASM domain
MTTSRPRLQSLIVELTQRCNHACLHCYNVWQGAQVKPYPIGELSTKDTLDLLAKALDETRCSHITLTGGEPLLREDLFQILAFLSQKHVRVTVISNGRLLDESKVRALLQGGVSLFELPLLSHQMDVHDELSGSRGAWQAVLSAITAIRSQHGQVVASFVATRRNISHLQQVNRLAFAFGARGLMLNRFNPGGRSREHMVDLLPSVEQVKQALETAEAAVKEYSFPISCSIPIQPCLIDISHYPHLGFGYCAAGSERAYYTLDPLGNLRPCNHSELILGNLLEEPFSQLITAERMSPFKCAIPEYCRDCSLRKECQGGCKASAQVCYGSLEVEEPFLRQRTQVGSTASLPK